MKKYFIIALTIIIALTVLAGCTEKPVKTLSSSLTSQTPQSTHQQEGEEQVKHQNYYIYITKNSWDTVSWDNVYTPHLAFSTMIKELGEIPVSENGNFSIEFSGLLFENEVAKVNVKELNIFGTIQDIQQLAGVTTGTLIGQGTLNVNLNYVIHQKDWPRPLVEDYDVTVEGDMQIFSERDGQRIRITSVDLLKANGKSTYDDNSQTDTIDIDYDYMLSLVFNIVVKDE
ncbi:MAG TPA: hypothetical protein PLQ68_07535 [Clostridia bacterium]|nr:hypothetical protein [Clostridia bacterium]